MRASTRDCPVCGQYSVKTLFHPKSSPGPISRCECCQMVYVANIEDAHAVIFDGPVVFGSTEKAILTSSNLDDFKDSWELKYISIKEAEMPWLQINARIALEKIEANLGCKPAGQRILDYGAGLGFFLSVAKERGWEANGLEPLPASAAYARAKFGVNITTDTLRDTTYPKEYFDVVTAFQVFEHLPDPLDSIKCLSNVLKTGGLIVIEVPRFDTWTMPLLRSKHRHFVQDHLNFFSLKTLELFLRNNGFEIVENYQPKRFMSVQHLYNLWLVKRLPKVASRIGDKILQSESIRQKTIGVNIGDMLTVIGRKV